jgi:hypothetical protein
MTLDEVTIEALGILPTITEAQVVYKSEHGDYKETNPSHATVPPALGRVPTNDHYGVGTIPFSFRAVHIRSQGVPGWFLCMQTIKDGLTYQSCISGAGPEQDTPWAVLMQPVGEE